MALIPKITPCIVEDCAILRIKETTGVYSTSNVGGWNAPNITTSAAVTATLAITPPAGTVTTTNVLAELPATYVGEFYYTDIDIDAKDGEWTIVYTITSASTTYTTTSCHFSACIVRCCIDTLWGQIAEKELDTVINCKCDPAELTKLQNKAMFMEALYMQMMSAASWNNVAVRDKILVQLQRLCGINNCDCGCS